MGSRIDRKGTLLSGFDLLMVMGVFVQGSVRGLETSFLGNTPWRSDPLPTDLLSSLSPFYVFGWAATFLAGGRD